MKPFLLYLICLIASLLSVEFKLLKNVLSIRIRKYSSIKMKLNIHLIIWLRLIRRKNFSVQGKTPQEHWVTRMTILCFRSLQQVFLQIFLRSQFSEVPSRKKAVITNHKPDSIWISPIRKVKKHWKKSSNWHKVKG